MMKKTVVLLVITILLASLLFQSLGCASTPQPAAPTSQPAAPTSKPASPAPQPATPTAKPTSQPAAKPAEIVLKATTHQPSNDESVGPFMKWVDKVNSELKGQLSIKVLGGPEVIPSADIMEAVRNGVINIALATSGTAQGVVPEMMLFVIARLGSQKNRDSGLGALVNDAVMKKANAYYMGTFSDNNQFWLVWNTEVKNPRTGFKGLKLRGAATYNPGMKTLGAVAINIPLPELYPAMERKVVDGFGQPLVETVKGGFVSSKMIKYAASMGIQGGQTQMLMNLDTWKSIPEPIQKKLIDLLIASEQDAGKFWLGKMDEAIAALKTAGVKIPDWAPDDKAWFETVWADGILADLTKSLSAETMAKFNAIIKAK